ncbi:MAG: tetratricopeptide repeat protein [Myxococcales bacterium]|nr:tetratricopeptide repeat protein [Myxococcales bacterium]MCB9576718.1 tetratricopeptide repeat protein [Polyangiaceae bacterium]
MDLEQRLNHLESHHDWQGLTEALEQSIVSSEDASVKADLHLRLGRLLHTRFLQGVKALKHFQDAYKLNPALVEALAEARLIYWELGKLNMVQKLLELQLKNTEDPTVVGALYRELGDVHCDLGDYERAADAYAHALSSADGEADAVGQLLEDVMVGTEDWQERIGLLLRSAHQAQSASERADCFLRAARIARRYAPEEVENILAQAYTSDPESVSAATLYEGLLVESERTEAILERQREVLDSIEDPKERASVAFRFGVRWALRHGNPEIGAELLEQVVALDPSHEAAFNFLRDTYGAKGGDWERVVVLAEKLADSGASGSAYLLATAGNLVWKEMGDLIRARSFFEKLAALDPDHPILKSFEAQIGASLSGGTREVTPELDVASEPETAAEPVAEVEAEAATPETADVEPEAAPAEAAPPAPADEAKIAQLRADLEEQESAKRYHEYVKTLVALADEVPDTAEKVELYMKAADLYVNKFVNQAEAVRTYEHILEVDPENRDAIDYLRQMYEKRRDWEKLIQLNTQEAERMEPGPERVQAFKDIAQLATDRVKKPDVCIDLWSVVLRNDPDDLDALGALGQMYERARDYEKLADVLEKQAELTLETKERVQILTKLGQVTGDRLKDDARAAEAYRTLLTLSPDDRRAQEQLKKRYISLGRWDDLEVFYAESGKWDEFIRVLESNESRADSDEQRIGMLMKVAELWMTQKGKPDRAARAYEKILNIDENSLDAAERLIPIYESANNPKGLSGAIEVKLGHVQDPNERLQLLRSVAELYETRINDKPKAFERYLAAFEIATSDEQSQADLERAAQLTGQWDEVVTAYKNAIAAADEAGDGYGANALRLRLGRVLVEEVQRVDEALTEYRAVYESEPENGVALEALERLYRETERWRDLLDVYGKKRELAADTEERKQILYEIARLYEAQLGEPAHAIETYQAVLEDDPIDGVALEALDRLYLETESWESYADVLRRRIELDVAEEDLVDLKFRLAETQRKHLSEDAAALTNYREILFLNQEHEGARQALEGLLRHETLSAEAASILEAIYEVREDWEKLIGALEILAAADSEQERRVSLLRKIAFVAANQLGALDRAMDAQARALKEDPSLADSRLELEQLAEAAAAWDRLIAIYGDIAAGLSDPILAREYWMRLADIEERLDKIAEAAESYEKVLALDPSDTEALQAMDALYRRTEHWEELVGVFRRRIDLTVDGAEREALYSQMAQVYEEKLGKPDDAILAYREVLGIDPASQLALSALDGLFTRQSMWNELAENLETQLTLADTELGQLELMLRLAALRQSQMGQTEAAIEGYRQVLDRDPTNQAALEALEQLGREAEHELAIAEILEPLYRNQGDFQKLIGVHEVQVRRAEDTHRRVELLHQIAELYEDAAGDVNAAFDTLARALAADPSHEGTQATLDRLARVTGRFQDLAGVFQQLAERQEDAELGSQLYTFAARVHENDVGDIDKAIELYRQVLSIDPMNLPAAESLQALFQSTERYADMSLILQRKATILDLVDDQKAALYQAAALEEELLERKENAIGVYLKILEIDPEDLRSIDALINLYLGLSRWEELLGVYGKKADLVIDIEEKKLIFYQVGAVFERELSDVTRAIDTYQRVLELDPDDLTALGRLDVLYQAAENWQELLSVLTHEAELTADPAEAVSYQYRIAELYERHLDDVERAVELYRDILGIIPDHAPTLTALEGIKNGSRAPMAAASVLEPVYDAMGEWARLISVLQVQAQFADDAFLKVDLLHRIARLYEENLGDHASAFETYARAVAEDSQNEESLASLERLAMLIERWPAVASLYDQELEKLAEEPERLVELGLRVAQVYEVQLEDVDNAVARYRRVLEADPENQSAVRALDRLFSQTERWQDLAEILLREAEIGQSPEEILEFKYRMGQVYQVRLGDLEHAIDAYREVLAAAPEHVETLSALEGLFETGTKQQEIAEILEPLYQSTAEWEKLIRVREAQLAHTTDPELRATMYHRIAEDAEERLLDAVLAFNVYVRAIKEAPLDERTGDEIERLAAMIDGGWEQLANAYADVLSLEGVDVSVQALIGKRLARVFEEELADVAKAEETYRYVLTVAPGEADALENLDRIYSSLEQWGELAGVLEQRAAIAEDQLEKVELYARLGQVYEEQLAQVPDAIRAYRVIFDELEPANEEAIAALGRIYELTESWSELDAVYRRELENAVGDVQEAEIRAKMARLASERLGKTEEAVEGWKRVLDLRGEDPEALWALAGLYESQGQWAELTDVLERHFDIADSDEERVNILTRRARLFKEQLGRDDEALETWQRVLDIDFSNIAALRAIANIWRERQDPQELVSALHATIDRAAALLEAEELKSIYRELGKTYGEVLEQPFDASEAWRHLLDVDPADFEAMDELEKSYRAEERWADVVGVKMQRAEALPEPTEQIRELLEVTQIWKKEVNDYDAATPAFERVLGIDPTHEEAFEALERLHTAAGRWEPLVELYLNRLETREEVEEKSDLLRRIARVFEEHLDDNNQAFDALVNAFSEDFGDDETVRYLERMAQATGRWGELINTANAWLQEQADDRAKIQLCLRLGKWYGEDLGHPEYAQPYYAQIMQLDPNNVQVLRQMAAIHRMGAQWQKMGETLTRALDVAVANEDRKAILVDLGELLHKHMGQADQGIAFYKRALEVDPLHLPALEALEVIYDERSNHSELVQILNSKVQALEDSEQIAQHKLRMGGLYETALGDFERAGKVYREVLELDGSNIFALRGLERIYEALQDWPDLVEILERQLDVVETERERVDVLLKLANIQEEQFLKADVAAQRLEQALEIDPGSEAAYVALERCYRRLKQWLDLINTYERHISEAADTPTKIEIYGYVAQVYSDEVGDTDRSIDAYQNIVDLDENNIPALEALSRLYEKQDDPARAIDAMSRVADLTTDGNQRVETYYRIGKSLEEKLGDRMAAQERFEMALDLDPSHLPSLAALRTIAIDEADWDRAARYLEQEQMNTQAPRARAKLLVELGKLRDEMLNEHEQAVLAYELAMQCDEDCEEAALPLVEEYIRAERWAEAEPLAEMLVRKSRNLERHEQHNLYKLLGKVHAALGNDDKALKAYQTAHQLDLTDQETIRGIADVAFKVADWPSALTNYQKVLTALGEDDVDERTDVYYRLGCIKREQGQAKQAVNNFEKALALNPEHRPTLEALVGIYEHGNDWKQVAAYKRQILDSVLDGEERYVLLNEIGDLWADRENNPQKAIEALEEALELKPDDHVLLHKLLQHYQAAGEWNKMVDTLQAIADIEEKPEIKSRYFYTMAQLYRDKIEDLDRAVELFNECLDLNPSYLQAFERINKVLTQQKNWKQLERSYRKMIHRIAGKGNTDLEHTLWHQLGLVYRDRLQRADEAIEAFRMASATKPEEILEHQILAELYEVNERFDEAISTQRLILERDPLRVDPYRALYRLYLQKHAYDEAWTLAAAMAFMKKADGDEQQFFEDYRPQGMLQVKGRLSNEHWAKHLFHADENLYVSKIMEFIAPAALRAKIAQLKAQGKEPVLDARFKQDPATSTVTFAKTFGWAAQVLGIPSPALYVRNDVPGSIMPVAAVPPASVAGQTVLTGFSPQELTFICGKHLAYYRGEHYIRTLFPTQAELTIMLFAGVMIASPSTPLPGDIQTQVRATAQELARHMEPVQLEGLRMVVKRFIEEGAKANIKRWNQAVEVTACRAGLLVSGDLEIAKKIIASEPQLPGDLSPQDKMKELLVFSVSESYAELRKTLGIAVG